MITVVDQSREPTMLSLDPGTRTCGVAWWQDGQLLGASVIHNPLEVEQAGPRECAAMAKKIGEWWKMNGWRDPATLALEIPQIYQRAAGKSKGNPNKIMPLYGVATALAVLFPRADVRFGTPHDWKGGVKKPKSVKELYAIQPRVLERLAESEKRWIAWPTNGRHCWDLIDAVGIGLHHLGRFERRRVFARE